MLNNIKKVQEQKLNTWDVTIMKLNSNIKFLITNIIIQFMYIKVSISLYLLAFNAIKLIFLQSFSNMIMKKINVT